jgi:caspase domain-containing protein
VRQAFLLGVERYGRGLPHLPSSRRDVAELGAVIEDPERGHFDSVERIRPSIQLGSLLVYLEGHLEAAPAGSEVLFYFSGHGAVDASGSLYLVLAQSRSLFAESLAVDLLLKALRRNDVASALLLLDCCYGGAAARDLEAERSALGRLPDSVNLPSMDGYAMLAAAGPEHTAKVDRVTGMSYFTQALVQTLRDPVREDGVALRVVDVEAGFAGTTLNLAQIRAPQGAPWRVLHGNRRFVIAYNPDLDDKGTLAARPSVVPADIYSRFDPAWICARVRGATSEVKVLQTWLPGVEAEAAGYGTRKPSVKYKVALLQPQSPFLTARLRTRVDVTNDFFSLEDDYTSREERFRDKIYRSTNALLHAGYGGALRLHDWCVPGLVYICDEILVYGLFWPHRDATVGPCHIIDRQSKAGRYIERFVDEAWAGGSSPENDQRDKQSHMSAPRTTIESRLVELERRVAWLDHPANRPGAATYELVTDTETIFGWSSAALIEEIRGARRSVEIVVDWVRDPVGLIEALAAGVHARITTLDPDSPISELVLSPYARVPLPASPNQIRRYRDQLLATNEVLRQAPEIDHVINSSRLLPGAIARIDDRVYYAGRFGRSDPWAELVHCVSTTSPIGRFVAEALNGPT